MTGKGKDKYEAEGKGFMGSSRKKGEEI